MTLVFVGHRCCDHSPSSGYDQICSAFPEAGWLDGRALAGGETVWIRPPQDPRPSPPLFHVFYGDCSGSSLPPLLRQRFPQASVVSTVHQPIERLRNDPAGWASLDTADFVITVSEEQARQLSDLLSVPVQAVPHGVWTDAFRPQQAYAPETRRTVLMVGSYLRDWDGAQLIVGSLSAAGIQTLVVGAHGRLNADNPLVRIYPWVSETELVRLYQTAAALLLPVLDASASNALLEAMAAGCPVVCPRLPSLIKEYLGDDSDAYDQHDYRTAAARAQRLVHDHQYRTARSKDVLDRAQQFDWTQLRPRIEAIYGQVEAGAGLSAAHQV